MGATSTTIAAALQQTVSDSLISAASRASVLVDRLRLLDAIESVVGGYVADRHEVVYSGYSSAGPYAEGDSLPASGYQARMPAYDSWKLSHVILKVSGLAQAMSRGGAMAGVASAWESEIAGGMRDLLASLNSQLLGSAGGASSTHINGLQYIISASNTVHGIDQSTYSWWRAQTKDAGGAAVSADMLQQVVDACRDKAEATMPGLAPTAIYASRTQTRKMRALGIAKLAIPGPNPDGLTELVLPSSCLEFDGLPIVPMQGLANSIILVVSEPSFRWRILEQGDYPTPISADGLPTGAGFLAGVREVATGEDADSLEVKVYSNLICASPAVNGILSNLSTT